MYLRHFNFLDFPFHQQEIKLEASLTPWNNPGADIFAQFPPLFIAKFISNRVNFLMQPKDRIIGLEYFSPGSIHTP